MAHDDSYMSNPRLKKPGVKTEYTEEQIKEYIKCSKDPIYFIENYVKIIQLDRGIVPFELWDFQRDIVNTFNNNRFAIAKLPRQVGKTTTVGSYILWLILFTPKYEVAILANKLKMSKEILARIKMSYENVPKWMQQGVVEWSKESIELENGSSVMAASTSSDAIRGFAANLIYLDEFAFVPKNIQEEFYTSVYPVITSGKTTKLLITSTPNGLDMFYKLWADSEQGKNDFHRVECHWSDVPGRDEAWREQTIRNTSELQFEQEFECHFLGSSHTLIAGSKLRTLTWREPDKTTEGFKYYEPAQKGHSYAITVDTAQGVGLDYSAFVVYDVTSVPYKVVCTYRNNEIHPIAYPRYIVDCARYYNKAQVLIETNDQGAQVANIIYDELEYENLISTFARSRKVVATAGFGVKSTMGIRTTKTVKNLGCSTLKSLVETDKLIINDYNIINELSHFALKGSATNSTYEADQGNDDLVMCCVLFSWLTTQNFFRDMTDTNVVRDIYDLESSMIEEELVPFGVISSGQEEEYEHYDGDLWRMG